MGVVLKKGQNLNKMFYWNYWNNVLIDPKQKHILVFLSLKYSWDFNFLYQFEIGKIFDLLKIFVEKENRFLDSSTAGLVQGDSSASWDFCARRGPLYRLGFEAWTADLNGWCPETGKKATCCRECRRHSQLWDSKSQQGQVWAPRVTAQTLQKAFEDLEALLSQLVAGSDMICMGHYFTFSTQMHFCALCRCPTLSTTGRIVMCYARQNSHTAIRNVSGTSGQNFDLGSSFAPFNSQLSCYPRDSVC